ncbi:MAG: class I SAM-dependent methyltransferase [Actinomycetota bacterium]
MPHTSTTDDTVWVEAGRAWSHAAAAWAYHFEPHARDAADAVFARLGTGLLNIACGSGYATGRAERLGATVAGLDASEALLLIAQRRTRAADLRLGDMFALPWADDSFDVATSFNGIWGGCEAAIGEAARVLRPGGRIGITFWGPGGKLDLRQFLLTLGGCLPAVADEMKATSSIGAPGVAETMLTDAGFSGIERFAADGVLELPDAESAWRTMRSPGLVVPALDELGDREVRRRLMPTLEPFRSADGSYRLVNELTCVTAVLDR